ncbi:MAG: metallophosphoesterase [Phycisphaerae bacterium]|nr:metallophosphoesterase [Phycisphaerae bacterium]
MKPISKKRQLIEQEHHIHPVSRGWRRTYHLENMPRAMNLLDLALRFTFLDTIGRTNALNIKTEEIELCFENLPATFNNTRILLITDLHINGNERLTEKLLKTVAHLDYDICILGGDYSFGHGAKGKCAWPVMGEITSELLRKSPVYGILGNHDRYGVAQHMQEQGAQMLINEHGWLENGTDRIYLTGLDDCHYHKADDLPLADKGIPDEAFKIMLSHSSEPYRDIARAGYHLCLTGHTHGGQVCLPGGFAPVTCTTVPRKMIKGTWRHENMTGYTSRGVGTSGLNVRFFCPPEITIITLKPKGS